MLKVSKKVHIFIYKNTENNYNLFDEKFNNLDNIDTDVSKALKIDNSVSFCIIY